MGDNCIRLGRIINVGIGVYKLKMKVDRRGRSKARCGEERFLKSNFKNFIERFLRSY